MRTNFGSNWIFLLVCFVGFSFSTGCSNLPEEPTSGNQTPTSRNSPNTGNSPNTKNSPNSGTVQVGGSCQRGEDCAQGFCLTKPSGGYCSMNCGGQGQNCPTNSLCTSMGTGNSICMKKCYRTSDCRNDYVCLRVAEQGICFPRCQSDGDCANGASCNRTSGVCEKRTSREPNRTQVGNRCSQDSDCQQGGTCITNFRGGYCSAYCNNGKSCPNQSTCVAFTKEKSMCLSTCSSHQDCRGDQFCAALDGGSACLPKCQSDSNCASGYVCQTSSGQCQKKSQGNSNPSTPSGQKNILNVGAGIASPKKPFDFSFEVPQNAISMTLVVEQGNSETPLAFYSISDPNHSFILSGSNSDSLKVLSRRSILVAQVPNSPSLSLLAGTYRVSVLAKEETKVSLRVIFKYKKSASKENLLHLNLFFVGLDGINGSLAQYDPYFQKVLSLFKQIYAKAGIRIGKINYYDLNEEPAQRLSVINSIDGPNSELGQLFRTSHSLINHALNFFFVKEIKGGAKGLTIMGITGGLPGPAFFHGTRSSGVAISTLGWKNRLGSVAQVMAHEGGHYLGLFHLSESQGRDHDPLPDTPQCTEDRDVNEDGMVNIQECEGHGADNTMFWMTNSSGSQVQFTPHQRFVLMRNPLIQ